MRALLVGILTLASVLWTAVWWSSRDASILEGGATASVSTPPPTAMIDTGRHGTQVGGALVASPTSTVAQSSHPSFPVPIPAEAALEALVPGQIGKPKDAFPAPPPPPTIKPNEKGEIDLTASDPNTRMFSDVLREGYERRLRDEAKARTGLPLN